MRGLFRADLQQLGNLGRTRDGRKLLLLLLAAQGFFLMIGATFGALLENPGLRQQVRSGTTDPALAVGLLLVPVGLVLLRIGLGSSARQLFSGPEVPLLLSSPVPALQLVARGLWRLLAGVLFWCLGFTLVAVFLGTQVRLFPAAALWRLPLAMTLLALAPLALVQMAYALAMRWAASRATQLVFSLLGSVAFLAFFVLMAGSDRFAGQRADLTGMLGRFESGILWRWLLEGPARFTVHGGFDVRVGVWMISMLAVVAASCAVTAAVYRRAFENSLAVGLTASRSRGSRRRWPSGLTASLLRKEWLALAQQPARIVGLLLSAGLLGWMALAQGAGGRSGFLSLNLPEPSGDRWFDGLLAGGALLGLTTKLALFVLPSFSISVFQGESKQWPLIAASPADRRAFLLSKGLTAVLMLTPYLAAAVVIGVWTGLSAPAFLLFTALAPLALGALVAPMIALGCSPMLMRPAAEGDLGPKIRAGLGMLVIYPVLLALMGAGYMLWSGGVKLLESHLATGGDPLLGLLAFGGAWWLAADLLIWLCWRVARRNVERYFAARV